MTRQLLDEEEIATRTTGLAWRREGNALVKEVTLADFAESLAWVNQVGALAEARDHHPDISISWNKVTLHLTTHSAGGLTGLDFDLATAIDAIGA